jgi:DNA modification methylase
LKQALFRDYIIWYKKNNVSSSSKDKFIQAYEVILFLSKNEKCFTAMNRVRTKGSDMGRNKTPPSHLVQYESENRDKEKIVEILAIIHKA